MTGHSSAADDDNAELLSLLSSLRMQDPALRDSPTPPPRTPSPAPRPVPNVIPHTFPRPRTRDQISPPSTPTIYRYVSPTKCGYTTEWSEAGTATQGVSGAHWRIVQPGTPKKKKGRKKGAYAVFCGRRCGVFYTWDETERLVTGASGAIFRGYSTAAEAYAAFNYAAARSWTRVCGSRGSGIPALPQPALTSDASNPLHISETLDDLWYVVYRGITPGVYRSLLESQLNVVGIPNAVHESVIGKAAAFAKYEGALRRGEVSVLVHSYVEMYSGDPFA